MKVKMFTSTSLLFGIYHKTVLESNTICWYKPECKCESFNFRIRNSKVSKHRNCIIFVHKIKHVIFEIWIACIFCMYIGIYIFSNWDMHSTTFVLLDISGIYLISDEWTKVEANLWVISTLLQLVDWPIKVQILHLQNPPILWWVKSDPTSSIGDSSNSHSTTTGRIKHLICRKSLFAREERWFSTNWQSASFLS